MARLLPALLTGLVACALLCPMPRTAHAQEGIAEVVILKFDTFDTEPKVMELFARELQAGIESDENMTVSSSGASSLVDLFLTIGCDDVPAVCLPMVKDFVEGDRIVFGAVQRSEDIHLFTIRVYDFTTDTFLFELEDQTVQGDLDQLGIAIPALVESLLYGDVGVLNVSTQGDTPAEVSFDGKPMGQAPLELEELPLGEHIVSVKAPDGSEKSKRVVLRRKQPAQVVFDIGGVIEDPDPSGGGVDLTIPGWAAVGVGVIGVGVGVWGTFNLLSLEQQATDQFGNSDRVAPGDLSSAQDLQNSMNGAYTRQIVGFSVGALGLVAGGAMLLLSSGKSGEPSVSLDVTPLRGGSYVGLSGRF